MQKMKGDDAGPGSVSLSLVRDPVGLHWDQEKRGQWTHCILGELCSCFCNCCKDHTPTSAAGLGKEPPLQKCRNRSKSKSWKEAKSPLTSSLAGVQCLLLAERNWDWLAKWACIPSFSETKAHRECGLESQRCYAVTGSHELYPLPQGLEKGQFEGIYGKILVLEAVDHNYG